MEKIKYTLLGRVEKNTWGVTHREPMITTEGKEISAPPELVACNPRISKYMLFEDSFDYEVFFEGELEKPPFEVGETIWIEEKGIKTTIKKAMRTTKGSYRYETSYLLRVEVDESTRPAAEALLVKKLAQYYRELETLRERNEELKENRRKEEERSEEFRRKMSNKWYEFWK